MSVIYYTVDESFLMDVIHRAEHEVSLTAPGISMAVAIALLEAAVRLGGNVHLLVDASSESFRMGYCDPEVIRFLQQGCLKQGLHSFHCEPRIRTGVLTADGETIFFTPDTLTMEKLGSLSINGASSHVEQNASGTSTGLTELTDIVILEAEAVPLTNPQTKEEQLHAALREKQAQIEALEKKVKDLELEKGKLPIQQNLQFVDIEVSQYRLDRLRIRIPSAFLTDTQAVNERMDSKYLVMDPGEEWKAPIEFTIHGKKESYTLARFFSEIEGIRNNFTVTLGPWKRCIRAEAKDEFETEWKRLRDVAWEIQHILPGLLQKKIYDRLYELFQTLEPQILRQYKNKNWLGTDESEIAKENFFFDQMRPEIEHSLNFFDPQIKVIYRDISREDAESQEFHKEVEKAFGKASADQMFAEVKTNNSRNS